MPRKPPRCDQDGIKTDIADAVIIISREPSLGSGGNAQTLTIGDRPCGVVQLITRLDLDEYQQGSASRYDIDFTDRAAPTPRQDAKAFGDEKRRRSAFGGNTRPKRDLTLWTRGLDRGCRSEEHTSELQSRENLVCRLLLEKKKTKK